VQGVLGMLQQYTLLLAHGAGAGVESDFMKSILLKLNNAGLETLPFEFPYMKIMSQTGKRRPPDRMPKLIKAFHEELQHYQAKYPNTKIIVGGKSMGGRVASLLSAQLEQDNKNTISGCICLGFPFHPPKKLEKYRGAHLEKIKTFTLILQGDRDIMGCKEEVEKYKLADSISIKYITDGDHSFKPRVRSGHTLEGNISMSSELIINFVNSLSQQVLQK